MVNSKTLANSVAAVGGATFIICRLLAAAAPNFLFSIGQSWFHSVVLAPDRMTAPIRMGGFFFGLVTFVLFAWVFTYATAELYNRWNK